MRKTLLMWAAIAVVAAFVFSGPAASQSRAGMSRGE